MRDVETLQFDCETGKGKYMIYPTQENEPSNSLPCGHALSWLDEDNECSHMDCILNRMERRQQRWFHEYYGGSAPQTDRERSLAVWEQKRKLH